MAVFQSRLIDIESRLETIEAELSIPQGEGHGGRETLPGALLTSYEARITAVETTLGVFVKTQSKKTPESKVNWIRLRFLATMITIMKSSERVGNTVLFSDFKYYLRFRDNRVGKYGIHLSQGGNDDFTKTFEMYKAALASLPSVSKCEGIEWIGSTAVPGLISKPVMDIMLTLGQETSTSNGLRDFVCALALELADPTWVKDKSAGLEFPIGFCFEGWGFLQMPHYIAEQNQRMECNVHVFVAGSERANEKTVVVEYLKSEEGSMLKKKYSDIKLDLERQFEAGELEAKAYSAAKGSIIGEILDAAQEWKRSS